MNYNIYLCNRKYQEIKYLLYGIRSDFQTYYIIIFIKIHIFTGWLHQNFIHTITYINSGINEGPAATKGIRNKNIK